MSDAPASPGPAADAGPLSRERWASEALKAMARGGVAAVAVEPLARALGVTKGSFYWHFKNRDALIAAALERLEHNNAAAIARSTLVVLRQGAASASAAFCFSSSAAAMSLVIVPCRSASTAAIRGRAILDRIR